MNIMEINIDHPCPSKDIHDQDLLCPISMEIMVDPVTICTGVTYERKNIEKWFKKYKKNTCPATMQCIDSFEMTPNHTLKRLIQSWKNGKHQVVTCDPSNHEEMVSLIKKIESTPFKVSSLKKLRSFVELGDETKRDLVKIGGVEVLVKIIVQILVETCDFTAFRACEEALIVLHHLLLVITDHQTILDLLLKPECMKSCALMLQRGSAEARFSAVSIFQEMARYNHHWSCDNVIQEEGIGFFKSLLEIISDDVITKSSSCALQVLIDISNVSKTSKSKIIEAGGLCILIELLPDSNKSKCEKIMQLITLICECDEGRLAFQEHGLGIAAILKKLLNVSNTCTRIGVKILWLICINNPNKRVLEEILSFGGVKKFVALLHISGQSSTKDRALQILKMHADFWKRQPCFPMEIHQF